MQKTLTKHNVMPSDLASIPSLVNPVVSTCGTYGAVVKKTVDKGRQGYDSSILVFDFPQNKSTVLSTLGRVDSVYFSPNGNLLAFVEHQSGEGASSQVRVLSVASIWGEDGAADSLGETRRTDMADGANTGVGADAEARGYAAVGIDAAETWFSDELLMSDLVWIPGSEKLICFSVQVNATAIKTYDGVSIKADGTGLFTHKEIRAVTVDNGGSKRSALIAETPIWSPTVSPDGKNLIFVRHKDITMSPHGHSIHGYNLESGETSLLAESPGTISGLSVAGREGRIIWSGTRPPSEWYCANTLWETDPATKVTNRLLPDFDRPTEPFGLGDTKAIAAGAVPVFVSDRSELWFIGSSHGKSQLYKADVMRQDEEPSTKPEIITPPFLTCVSQFGLSADASRALVVAGNPTSPFDLYLFQEDAESAVRLTNCCEEVAEAIAFSEPQSLAITAEDGLPIEAWYMVPTSELAKAPFPTVLVIHGGPHNSYGYGLSLEFQTLCSAGFAVLYVNPRGSQTYGDDFAKKVTRDWGGRDYADLMKAVDVLIEKGIADEQRLGVTGYSYGGYMTNWIISHTNRFIAAVSGGCVANLLSMHGTSDIGPSFGLSEQGAHPWDEPELLWDHSPMKYVKNVQTPVLLYHAEGDDRCPIGQSEEFYTALRVLGREAKFTRYPGGSHLFILYGPPHIRIDKMERVITWFKDHLMK